MAALLSCAEFGIEPNGRDAHLLPYGKTCQLIIDWKGLVKLAKQSGEVSIMRPDIVCENDYFTWKNGVVDHEIDFKQPRGEIVAAYSYVKTKDGEDDYEVLTLEEIDKVRNTSKTKNSGPWVDFFSEMCKKTAVRRHSKRLTLSPEFTKAVEIDDQQFDLKPTQGYEVPKQSSLPPRDTTASVPQPAQVIEEPSADITTKDSSTNNEPSPPPAKEVAKATPKAKTKASSKKLDVMIAALVSEQIPEDRILETINLLGVAAPTLEDITPQEIDALMSDVSNIVHTYQSEVA